MRLDQLILDGEYECDKEFPGEIEISEIASKTNAITENSLFILVESINLGIDRIINYVKAKRPLILVCEKEKAKVEFDFPVVYVKNARLMTALIYSRFYEVDYSKTKFIGVTGTNGKSSTAEMIRKILRYSGASTGFIGTGKIEINGDRISDENYSMTTPDPDILYPAIRKMQDRGCEYAVMEVSSHALYFDKVTPIPFELSLFTNLSQEHLDFHNDIDGYFLTKLKLFSQTKKAVFNFDDSYSKKAFEMFSGEKSSVGIIWGASAVAKDIKNRGFLGMDYIYREEKRAMKISLKLAGAYNIYNSLMAIRAAIMLGIRPCIAKEAIEDMEKIEGRFEIINSDVHIIIDYAHTPYALESFLKSVNSIKSPRQRLSLVFGCGGDRDRIKRPIMGKIAEENADFVIITTDNSRNENEKDIISDILEGMSKTEKRKVITSRQKAIEYAILSANSGDVVTLVGKGHERYNIDKNGYHFFDEREIIRSALEKRKNAEHLL